MSPSAQVEPFYDRDTSTFTYVVYDRDGGRAAIVDPVLDYDAVAARTATRSAEALLAFVHAQALTVDWILETHAHADHLTAAAWLRDRLGAKVAIGAGIVDVQRRFAPLFGAGSGLEPDGRQFDRLFVDGDTFDVGTLQARVLATPGHTDDSLTYVIGDAAFVGDTLFAPETGTARCDFPGGDAARLHASIRRIHDLPEHTRLFLCHDYPNGREPRAAWSLDESRGNVHLTDLDAEAYVALRRARDATLPPPRLILPALQVNLRAGRLPEPDADGIRYLRLPLNQLGART
ncbi:MBL fold metallo-hydrolase [Lysobacter xanthus]